MTRKEKTNVKIRLNKVLVYGSRIRSDSVGGGDSVPFRLPPLGLSDRGKDHKMSGVVEDVRLLGSPGSSGGESVDPFRCRVS